jgi:hypothetical protein
LNDDLAAGPIQRQAVEDVVEDARRDQCNDDEQRRR